MIQPWSQNIEFKIFHVPGKRKEQEISGEGKAEGGSDIE
jgi:hypothetical protein